MKLLVSLLVKHPALTLLATGYETLQALVTSTSNSNIQAFTCAVDVRVLLEDDEMATDDSSVTVEATSTNPWGGANVPQPAAPTTGNGFGMGTGWVFNGTTWVMCFAPPPPGGTAW